MAKGKAWTQANLDKCVDAGTGKLKEANIILMATAGIRKELLDKIDNLKTISLNKQEFRYEVEN